MSSQYSRASMFTCFCSAGSREGRLTAAGTRCSAQACARKLTSGKQQREMKLLLLMRSAQQNGAHWTGEAHAHMDPILAPLPGPRCLLGQGNRGAPVIYLMLASMALICTLHLKTLLHSSMFEDYAQQLTKNCTGISIACVACAQAIRLFAFPVLCPTRSENTYHLRSSRLSNETHMLVPPSSRPSLNTKTSNPCTHSTCLSLIHSKLANVCPQEEDIGALHAGVEDLCRAQLVGL